MYSMIECLMFKICWIYIYDLEKDVREVDGAQKENVSQIQPEGCSDDDDDHKVCYSNDVERLSGKLLFALLSAAEQPQKTKRGQSTSTPICSSMWGRGHSFFSILHASSL